MPSTPITLRDVALSVGVSTATISLALRNHPKIPPARRAQIQKVAQELGYHPNAMAAALVSHREHSRPHPVHAEIAWVHQWTEPARLRGFREFAAYRQGAFQAAEHLGYRLEEFATAPGQPLRQLVKVLEARNVQAILLPPHGQAAGREADWSGFPWERFSVVRLGYSLREPPAHRVASNQLQASRCACSQMRGLGYGRIGFFTANQIYTRFRAGVLMAQSEIPEAEHVPPLVLKAALSHGETLQQLRAWLDEHRPEAILTDCAAIREMLAEIDRKVPGEIGVATLSVLDGNSDAGIFQNSQEVGRVAVETLIALQHLNHRGIPELYRETLVQGWWQDGNSLPPKSSAKQIIRQPQPASTG